MGIHQPRSVEEKTGVEIGVEEDLENATEANLANGEET